MNKKTTQEKKRLAEAVKRQVELNYRLHRLELEAKRLKEQLTAVVLEIHALKQPFQPPTVEGVEVPPILESTPTRYLSKKMGVTSSRLLPALLKAGYPITNGEAYETQKGTQYYKIVHPHPNA